ncbi:FliM/FliN family flagellar motor switch protein [Pantoea allii]|uniref:Flagellar motor switch protein FliN n=1 Tax=Pantoea allii TaxID=574096 RepID=A0ABS6VA19_9GAMM|nr:MULTISPECIES: FliM/FliN family flagellar motor switch protein [Pantoea]MBW1212291.1 FliM/FliN family flagellar motor switch protein [Pantoea allii]MBW1252867.1 FliM/FliN family flagellar motor switch protein [Pantoea allii]MBW1256071.1 FliM/FliN family flagellar motor switch protein [Pantoea allii]MBW1262355.1 FliM/FliN family flagellar motor switch protein [Pantoea allii]MBW1265148.1 FliM/FliN family flagellar motor switch protein [Pantoea allii]
MSDAQQDLSQSLDFDDLNIGDIAREKTVEGNIRLDIQEKPDVVNENDDLRKIALFSRIPVNLTLEVASVEISLADLLTVNHDSVIELDKMAGEALDIKVNGILFGKAEAVMLNDKYGLRILEFNSNNLGELTR